MSEATIRISEELLPHVDSVVKEFGFANQEEFVQEAIRDKVLELQRKLFFQGSDKIAEQLRKRGVTEKEILEGFERRKQR